MRSHCNMKLKSVILSSLLFTSSTLSAAIIKPINGVIEQVDPVINQLEPRITSQVESIRKHELIDDATAIVTSLPKRLEILNQLQAPAFVEVDVEHGFRAVERQWIMLANEQHQEKLLQIGAQIIVCLYTHLRAHETVLDLVCRLLLEKKKKKQQKITKYALNKTINQQPKKTYTN